MDREVCKHGTWVRHICEECVAEFPPGKSYEQLLKIEAAAEKMAELLKYVESNDPLDIIRFSKWEQGVSLVLKEYQQAKEGKA